MFHPWLLAGRMHMEFLIHRFCHKIAQCSPLPCSDCFGFAQECFWKIYRCFQHSNIYSFTARVNLQQGGRMTMREGMAKSECRTEVAIASSSFEHSSLIRHLSFVHRHFVATSCWQTFSSAVR